MLTGAGTYTATFTVTDGDGGTGSDTLRSRSPAPRPLRRLRRHRPTPVTPPPAVLPPPVTPQSVSVSLPATISGVRGQPLSIKVSTTTTSLSGYQVSWNFGDGTCIAAHSAADAGALAPSHIYTAAGKYTVRRTVCMGNGTLTTTNCSVVVQTVQLQPDPANPLAPEPRDRRDQLRRHHRPAPARAAQR